MHDWLLVSLVCSIVPLAAVATGTAAGSTVEASDSGIVGEVRIGPLSPAERAGQPSPDAPFSATLSVRAPDDERELLAVRSAQDGQFRINLAPGIYRLVPVSPNPGAPPYAEPLLVTVEPGKYTRVTIKYDSGIR
jgi:hypothetical protein